MMILIVEFFSIKVTSVKHYWPIRSPHSPQGMA